MSQKLKNFGFFLGRLLLAEQSGAVFTDVMKLESDQGLMTDK